MGAWGQEKEKVNKFWGVYWRVLPPARCHVVFRRSPAVLRTTSDTPTEARTTGQLRDRQLAVVVTCLCVGGPCALPFVGSCLGKTCGVLDGLTTPESERPLVRRIILTGNKCNMTWYFFLHQYEHKTVVIYWTE